MTQSDQNETSKYNETIDKQQNTAKDEAVVSSSLSESLPKENEENITEMKAGSVQSSDGQAARPVHSPEKRVTRSITGNLKPKQQFDEIQEKEELKNVKRKDGNVKRGRQNKTGKVESSERKKKKDEAAKTKNTDGNESEDESSSDDDEMDFHEDDSDYSPEDDPDRPWCICRKPHGNKYENSLVILVLLTFVHYSIDV